MPSIGSTRYSSSPWQFLLVVNVLLLAVGAIMDILSAMFIFVPLSAPMRDGPPMYVDPMHFGIIFIVNLELGYLTPPVGLNLFVASTLFDDPSGTSSEASCRSSASCSSASWW